MGPVSLFLVSSVIWGSTWLAITFQLGVVAPEASVAYRFALAALLLGLGCLATGRSLRFPLRHHALFAAQGALFFGLNYVAIYRAEQYIASGLVAVLFSTIVFMSLVGTRLAFGTPITARASIGAVARRRRRRAAVPARARGRARRRRRCARASRYGLGATAARLRRQSGRRAHAAPAAADLSKRRPSAWATVRWWPRSWPRSAAWRGRSTRVPATSSSLAYLAVFGSIVAFGTYLTLLKQVGAGPASYVGVATPVVAMLLSTCSRATAGRARGLARRRAGACAGNRPRAAARSARRPRPRSARSYSRLSFASTISFFQLVEIGLDQIAPSRSGGPGIDLGAFALEPRPDVRLREHAVRVSALSFATTSRGVPAGATMPQ